MTNDEVLTALNGNWPPYVKTMRGAATRFDLSDKSLDMDFEADLSFCHSGDIVQGGFLSGMLDAVMAFAAIATPGLCKSVATLEIKVSFMRVARNGKLSATGRVLHSGRSIAYLDGQLFQKGELVAAASSTVKLLNQKRSG